jgi:nucleoid-associated protein YgaU
MKKQPPQVGSGVTNEEPSQQATVENYTIQEGDTLWSIAATKLGDGNAYLFLKEYNQLSSEELAVGQVIKVPSLSAIPERVKLAYGIGEQTRPTATGSAAINSDQNKQEGQSDAGKSEQRTITVQPGDCLWNLAKTHMGSGYDWTALYAANKGVVGANPDLIYPGQVLHIPAR